MIFRLDEWQHRVHARISKLRPLAWLWDAAWRPFCNWQECRNWTGVGIPCGYRPWRDVEPNFAAMGPGVTSEELRARYASTAPTFATSGTAAMHTTYFDATGKPLQVSCTVAGCTLCRVAS